MLTCTQRIDEAFVEIGFSAEAGDLYGAKAAYSLDGKEYHPCAMYRGRDADSLLECTFWEWNQAVEYGHLKFGGPPHPVYWHLYLNGLHEHRGTVHLRVEALRGEDVVTWETTVDLLPSRTVFLHDWQAYIGDQPGWKVDGEHGLTVEPGAAVSPLRVPLPVTGRYDVYLGIRRGTCLAFLKSSHEDNRYPFLVHVGRVEFQTHCRAWGPGANHGR